MSFISPGSSSSSNSSSSLFISTSVSLCTNNFYYEFHKELVYWVQFDQPMFSFFLNVFNFISFVQVLVYNSFTFIILKSRYNIRFEHILCARTLSRSFIFPLTQIVIPRPQSIHRESWPAGNKKKLINSIPNQEIRFKIS